MAKVFKKYIDNITCPMVPSCRFLRWGERVVGRPVGDRLRMNVDNFDEAYELLSSHGFKNFYEDKIVQTESFKSAIMISPSGFAFNVIEHIKK